MDNKSGWESLAEGLLEYETLTGAEIERVMRGEPPHKGDDEDDGKGEDSSVTAIPKTKPRKKPKLKSDDGDMEPEPTA